MEEYEKYREAGKIARDALHIGIKNIKEGRSYKEIAEKIETYILDRASLAFPVNISVNSTAAHYTPSMHDENVFKKGDVVKLDVGAHVDGYIGDTAKTVEIGTKDYSRLIEAAEKALEEAIKIIRDGIKIEEIGKKIEDKIREYGYNPIRNLHGHSLERYKLHAGISIPNYHSKSKKRLRQGQAVAIEPFVTDGVGIVVDGGIGNIYRIEKDSPVLKQIKNRFNGFPFAERWLYDIYGESTPLKLSFFLKRRMVAPYFKLVEMKGGMVAQAEHTLYITEDGCEVLTA
jgi:methionyl aminopeptidase